MSGLDVFESNKGDGGLPFPNELLVEIFLVYLALAEPDYDKIIVYGTSIVVSTEEYNLPNHLSPQTLAQVCRHWHELVYSYPQICATVIIPPHPSQNATNLIRKYLSHSRQCLLTIRFPLQFPDSMEPLLSACLKEAHRWRSVYLPGRVTQFSGLLSPSSFPHLEILVVPIRADWSFLPNLDRKGFPRLRRAYFIQDHQDEYREPFRNTVALPNMDHLTLSMVHYQNIDHLLHHGTSFLRSLHLHNIGSNAVSEPITLPHLTRLSLYSSSYSPSLARAIECPQLQELITNSCLNSMRWACPPRISPKCADLFWDPTENSAMIRDFVEGSPQLTKLRLRTAMPARPSFRKLYRVDDLLKCLARSQVCPQLTHISIDLEDHPRVYNHGIAILNIVHSHVPTLRYAHVHFKPPLPAETRERSGEASSSKGGGQLEEQRFKTMVEEVRQGHPHVCLDVKYDKPKVEDQQPQPEANSSR